MASVRVLETSDDLARAFEVFRTALIGIPPYPGEITGISEPGRVLGGVVDDEIVGTAAAYSSTIVVPGGARLPHLAVTRVGVLPTHTRRGVARSLMNYQLADARQRGVPIATLRAAEGGIYERYGYGIAAWIQSVEVAARKAVFRPGVPVGGPVRLAAAPWADARRVYERVDPSWVGAMSRTDEWWTVRQVRSDDDKEQAVVVLHGPPGAEDGYVRYHPGEWRDEGCTLLVDDFVAGSLEARLGLLRYLFSVDLVGPVRFDALPMDDPIREFLVDVRPVKTVGVEDEIWLRLVDVPSALAARTYRGPGEVVVGVVDEVLPENAGAYWIGASGAKPTTAAPQLTVDVAALGAAYLGGVRWRDLVAAGRVTVADASAVAVADELFAVDAAPYCGTFF
ncbi:GNAT family N-acetyltransferase [Cryptosporangium phraense]|uniref:GNAT family N-acetyltransferase n=1 Tax=Cryptosporangium phraense TaxID=2593070 RepID=A0A545AHT3_9ACTN|nr:GNAT family N-acetyltransferase [Cryptosporangium phraense]TQS40245.1 GNAT family N-acetyltransferase [Cryptosporangium phraense]